MNLDFEIVKTQNEPWEHVRKAVECLELRIQHQSDKNVVRLVTKTDTP